jgi:hypothetical protein
MQSPIILDPAEIPSATPAGLPIIEYAGKAESLLLIQTDLSKRLNIQIDTIEVISVQSKQWADGSLGCPQPGMVYAQVLTSGYQIILKAANQLYEYHTDTGRSAILCNFNLPAVAQTAPTQSSAYEIRVHANQGWQNTGIALNKGDKVIVAYVSDLWFTSAGDGGGHDASGGPSSWTCSDPGCHEPLHDFPKYALIGKVNDSSEILKVGNYLDFTASISGNLYLRPNYGDVDIEYFNPVGSILVKITVGN